LEIFTITNKTFYLNFKIEQDREFVIFELCKKVKNLVQIIDDLKDTKDSFNNVLGYENSGIIVKKNKKKRKKSEKRIKKLSYPKK